PVNHPLRPIRRMVDEVLKSLSRRFEALRGPVLEHGPALGTSGEIVADAVAAGALHGAQRATLVGATGLQPLVPLVCGFEHGRSGMGCDGIFEKPRSVAEGRRGASLFRASVEAGPTEGSAQ